ncbi:MAG: hypothetical protein K2L21_06950 [Muribaculaceae bacterium]|nr:hypothetical protein [Muribaculaceae bacterium]
MTLKDIRQITEDSSVSIDDRIEAVFKLMDEHGDDGKDAMGYLALIDMIEGENAIATHVLELMQLYTLLAEACEESKEYREMEDISVRVRAVLRDERIAWDVIEATVPRIIEAMESTVYNHETYRLLLAYVHSAFINGKLGPEMKGRVRRLLKLNILLEDNSWFSHWIENDMREAIASLFTPDELLKIILNPTIGHLKADPVEYTYRWEEIYYDVEEKLNRRFDGVRRHMGFCFKLWSVKRELLKNEYGIEWRSPAQMNPRVMFD